MRRFHTAAPTQGPVVRVRLAAGAILSVVGLLTWVQAAAAPEGLERLRSQIQKVIPAADGTVGVAIKHLESGAEVYVNADDRFPMASTFKLPVLVELYAKAKAGLLRWDDTVDVQVQDQHIGSGEISYLYDPPGVKLSLHNVANLMMMISDNSAADICLGRAGATDVTARMKSLGANGIRVDRPCQELILDYAGQDTERLKGMPLDEIGKAMNRRTPGEEARFAADDKFAADERDTATPQAFVILLEKIWRGEAVDKASSKAMLETMKRCTTGKQRIRGLLPPSTVVAHKTGTIGGVVNDIGVMYLPDNTGHVAIAVMTKRTRASEAEVERTIAQVARYAYDYFYFTSTARTESTAAR